MIAIILGIYLFIGILLVAFSPANKRIREEVDKARGIEFTNTIMGRQQPPELKIRLFQHTLTLSFIVLGIVFIWSIVQEYSAFEKKYRITKKDTEGMHFHFLGGYGTLIII